jgi:hypothetical protein
MTRDGSVVLTKDVLETADNVAARGGGGGVNGVPGDDTRGRGKGWVRVLHEGEPVADAVHRADLGTRVMVTQPSIIWVYNGEICTVVHLVN